MRMEPNSPGLSPWPFAVQLALRWPSGRLAVAVAAQPGLPWISGPVVAAAREGCLA